MNNTDDLPAVRLHMNLLYDFYGSLLTEKQATCFTMRHIHDYSLAEIGQELEISPQAVVDFLKRATEGLERYEKHLELVRRFQERKSLAECIRDRLDGFGQGIDLSDSAKESVKWLADAFEDLMLI